MSRIAGTLLVLFISALAGCGGADDSDRPALYPVKGTVTLNGETLAGASVTFYHKTGPTARGVTNDQGEFTLTSYDAGDGAVEGSHTITVQKFEGGEVADVAPLDPDAEDAEPADVVGVPADGSTDEATLPEAKSLVPVEFTKVAETTLTFVVKTDGPNEAKLEMTGSVD